MEPKTYIQNFVKRNRFVIYGVPFIVLLVGGSFGLRQFTQLRYQYRKRDSFSVDKAKEMGAPIKEERPSIESEYKKMKQEADLDNWVNIRGPRPWENSKVMQDEQRGALQKPQS